MSFKKEFEEVFSYLSLCCKDPTSSFIFTDPTLFTYADDKYAGEAHTIIYEYNSHDASKVKVPEDVKVLGWRYGNGEYVPFTNWSIDDDASAVAGQRGCFEGHFEITNIILPKGLKIIGVSAFFGCEKLESINIPDDVCGICNSAFGCCYRLKSIVFPPSTISLNPYVLQDCISLENVVLPNRLSFIREGAFAGCKKLKSITIPDRVVSIEADVFSDCPSLEAIYCPKFVKLSYKVGVSKDKFIFR